jgi:predicted ATPase/class 3 adenylate cyclase/Tfp pilus assembly protein PilF
MDKPTGTVTFLFTDIEGSTKLFQEFPEKLPSALRRHNEILRDAIESNRGHVFKIVGDAYCCAFENAADAVKAAVDVQRNLSEEKWDEAEIKIRIGIHSGNAEWNGHDYMGYMTLARTARVMSAAYGEQIIVSNDAYEIYKENLVKEKDFSFRDLGERRLKDVIEPIRLYQVISKDLREEFPPLKTLDARPNNLPIQLTSFIGREKEMKDVKDKLRQNRLLTLNGTGGSGKSRLSLQAGADLIDDFANGVWFVELAAVSDPEFLTSEIINALGIREEPKKTPEETLVDYLKDKEILIILDNCEHLINACAELTERLLSSCPKLKIIATSREALNCEGEQTFKIPALTHPDPNSKDTPEQLTQYESVRLFIERALSVNPKFRVNNENAPALAEVCSRLDGIPLAIELAAARTKVLSIEKIFERLDDRFSLLTGGKRTALPRQQTLRALIDWSYNLLTEEEKILWGRLSVFSGGWTLEAAEEVCEDEVTGKNEIVEMLSQLTEKSIVIYDESKERYRMLESMKQYGIEKLSDKNGMFLRHLNYYLELSEKAEPELNGNDPKLWLDILEADHSNFISAIDWSTNNENTEKGALVAAALGGFWSTKGHYSTGIRLNENIIQSPGEIDKSVKGKLLSSIGVFKFSQGDYEQAKKYSKESLAIRREIGDNSGIAVSIENLGKATALLGDIEQAKEYYEESLVIRKEIGDKSGIADSMHSLGTLSANQGDYEQAKEYYEESLIIRREIGSKNGIAATIHNLGSLSSYQGDYAQAVKYFEESLIVRKEIGDKNGIAATIHNLGTISIHQGNYEKARRYLDESLAVRKEIGDKYGIAATMNHLGVSFLHQGNYEQTKKYYERSLAVRKEIGDKYGIADSINNLGGVMFAQGNHELAEKYYEESLAIYKEIGNRSGIAMSILNLGHISCERGDYGQARKYFEESLSIRREIGDKKGIAECMIDLGYVSVVEGDYEHVKKYSEECLAIRIELGDKKGIASECMVNLGVVLANQGDSKLAVKLLSACEKIQESIGSVFEKNYLKMKDETKAKLRGQLSEEEFNKYWEEGKKLTLDEAVALALKQDDFG